jgi:2-keto-4-pentenoate hydratase/2-oxohepta-3-ene-1,7-dioic acid hydratase in catechol pathway
MKLIRFQHKNRQSLGVIKDQGLIDITQHLSQYTTMNSIIVAGKQALFELRELLNSTEPDYPLDAVKLLAPIERPGKYLAIGMNFKKHEEEADKLGVERRKFQTWFNKQTSCIAGPYDDIQTGVTAKLDYEVELALVIGKPAKGVSEQNAREHIFGYVVANDVSARDWQFHTPTFTMGKSFDTHGPIGPWLVTADEIDDPQNLDLRCYVNGQIRQSNNTSQMIHSINAQIAYLSTAFTLETGDLIATGTPEGVGVAMDPPVFLQPGDIVRCEVAGIGAIENRVAFTE